MHKFVRSLITEWRRLGLPFADRTIVVAVSGGADSMALLLGIRDLVARRKLRLRTVVAHFNHKLRGEESDADEAFVRENAEKLGFEFVSASGAIAKRGNLEQNARDARYAFLLRIAHENDSPIVLTGHTLNDQAETFLMNLIRGSGSDGLAAMRPVRELDEAVSLVRPLLGWAMRQDTEEFCLEHGVRFRTDRMNDELSFTRVKVRKVIIPALRELNPKIVETLARTAGILAVPPKNHSSGGEDAGNSIGLSELKRLPAPELYERLRSWLRTVRGDLRGLQLKHIEGIGRLIVSHRSGNTVELPGGGRVIKHGGRLTWTDLKVEK